MRMYSRRFPFHGEATITYTSKLRAMQGFFDLEDPSDGTMFLLISLLQLLPAQDQLLPILQEAREISGAIRAKDVGGKARGMVGIAATALLIQTHSPRLVPRRSFGSLPLKMDGFPRDTDSDKAPTVIDSLLTVLRKTFDAYPTSFKGPSVAVMRGVLSEAPVIRKGSIAILKKMLPKFAAPLARAKSEAERVPVEAPPVGLIPVMLPPPLGKITSFPVCGDPRSMWADPRQPLVRQPAVPLDSGLRPRASTRDMQRGVITVKPLGPTPAKDIQRRIKITAIAKTQGDTWRTNLLIAQRLGDAFEIETGIATIDVTQPPDLLRDIAEGLVKEMVATIARDPIKKRAYEEFREKDITLFALLATLKDAVVETNTLRAKERHLFTDRMREMTDSQRQITKDLLDRGMAPHILTNADRDVYAAQIERELEPLVNVEVDVDTGVGAPRDAPDDDEFIGEAPELLQPVGRIPPWAATGRGAASAPPQAAGTPVLPQLRPRVSAPARVRIPGERYFRDGDRVLHATFGEGIVVTSKLTRHDEEVTIAFAGSGVKTLAASIANLEVQG